MTARRSPVSTLVNPFTAKGRWYKANLHTHTTLSDGRLTPAERVEQYRKAGYSVLALSDHRRTQDISGLGDRRILAISAIEVHPVCHAPKGWWHIVGINVPRELAFDDPPADVNACIAEMRARGAAVILAHPAWCGQSFRDFEHLRGIDAVEVWNSTCAVAGRPMSESEWAQALDHGWRLGAVASDDCHHACDEDVLEAWTWLRMPSLSAENVVAALRTGSCYSSCGPVIHDFRIADGKLRLRCSPAAEIHFVSVPGTGRRRRAAPGKRITGFSLDVSQIGGWPWKYVRAVVTDDRGRKAWANPIYPGES